MVAKLRTRHLSENVPWMIEKHDPWSWINGRESVVVQWTRVGGLRSRRENLRLKALSCQNDDPIYDLRSTYMTKDHSLGQRGVPDGQ